MKRYNNYDLLRIIACISVIVIHVSFGFLSDKGIDVANKSYPFVIIWNTFSRFAVPVFIMLSGAFLLSNKENKDYKVFYKKSLKKLGIPIILFSILYFIYYLLLNFIQIKFNLKSLDSLIEPIKGLLTGTPYYHFWYLYTIIGLYLLTPIIIRFKESVKNKNYNFSVWVLLFLSCISDLTSTHLLSYDIGFSFYYIGYFMLGDVLKNSFENNKSSKKSLIYIIFAILFLFLLCPIHYYFSIRGMNDFLINAIQGNFNPFIMISSILIFCFFSNITIKKEFYKLSNLTLYIYIFHVIPCDFIFKVLRYFGVLDKFNPNLVIIIGTIFVFLISYLITKVWLVLWDFIKLKSNDFQKIDEFFKKD